MVLLTGFNKIKTAVFISGTGSNLKSLINMDDLSGNKHIKFNSYLELAYLHPSFFIPDFNQLKELDVKKDEKFKIL